MGIDYLIDYDCEPKRTLSIEGLMGRLKGRDRAQAIIQLYREGGDQRSPSKMGFEMVRRLPDGTEETEVIIVQDLLNAAAELTPWEHFCTGCPANRAGTPFGCLGTINYPVSLQAEQWLLAQLPDHETPLVFMLLQRAILDMGYTGEAAAPLRTELGTIFESAEAPERDINGYHLSGDQVFEMLFLSGPIGSAHSTLLLQFFGGISRNLEADVMMRLAVPPSAAWIDEHIPFSMKHSSGDDVIIGGLKEFFHALYLAYRLGVPVLLDV
jgi:hypothetical protein